MMRGPQITCLMMIVGWLKAASKLEKSSGMSSIEDTGYDGEGNFEDGLKVGWWVSGGAGSSVQCVRPCLAAHSSAPFILCPTVAQ